MMAHVAGRKRYVGTVAVALALLVTGIPLTAGATADGPDRFRVVDVHPGNTLSIRSGPSTSSERIGRIPADYDGLTNLGCNGGLSFAEWQAASASVRAVSRNQRWCRIEYEGITGWVAGRYLGESTMAASTGQTLHGTAWQLEIEGAAGLAEVWIAFSEAGEISGNTGCNRIMASFESSTTVVTISPIASTMMACLDEVSAARASGFLKALEGAKRFTMTADELTLRDQTNTALLTLRRRVGG
jgi:heat shock protein HslJ